MRSIVNLFHEIGMLAHIPRSGFAFLGSGSQSVAEHSFRVALIAHALARLTEQPINHDKLIMLCLVHDLPESRIGDLNYVQKKYVQTNLSKALDDIKEGSSLGSEMVEWIEEYETEQTLESRLAHDADQLELLLMLKKEQELGNTRAVEWFKNCCKRLKTQVAQEVAQIILDTPTDEWWQGNREDPHWVDGGRKQRLDKN